METGIKVNVVCAKKRLTQRLKFDGTNSPHDSHFAADVSRLNDVFQASATQSLSTAALQVAYWHSEGHWHGVTTRVKILLGLRDRVKPCWVR
jgi:iron(III) transport system substrate-binding protein